jgi:hypothetical protein
MRVITGHWVIGQLTSASQNPTSSINPCLDKAGIVGYGPRIPVNFLVPAKGQFKVALLDSLRKISNDKGKLFKPRIIFGKYALQVSGLSLPSFTDANGTGPMPYLAGGARNAALEDLMNFVYGGIADWAESKPDVRCIDCGWAALNYSEQYFGPGIQKAYGGSTSQNEQWMIASEKRMIDGAINAARGILPVGFGLSGHGPITNISGGIAAYLETKPKGSVTMQANGWAQGGEWGGALESALDQKVWIHEDVVRGLQDISAPSPRTAADNKALFARVGSVPGGIHYTESYYYEFGTNAIGRFHTDSAALNEFYNQLATVKTLTFTPANGGGGGGDNSEEIAALKKELADVQGQIAAANTLIATTQVSIADLEATLGATLQTKADLEVQAQEIQNEIDALEG